MVEQLQRTSTNDVVVDFDKCKGCGYCVAFCPRKILGIAGQVNRIGCAPAEVIKERARECTGCMACTTMCPDAAISLSRHLHSGPHSGDVI
jgi:2-oxoglutarate ferredoxin oxidoreductase subunit delta